MTNDPNDTIKEKSWKDVGFETDGTRPGSAVPPRGDINRQVDDVIFDRVIKFKGLDEVPEGNDEAKVYWDKPTQKLKMWIDAIGQWADIPWTTTSTSTTSSSSSSSSTSTTSSSSSTSTTSSSSTSTTL